ncbi:MAG: HNH endonuclease [Gemmatimonadales bacterium]
MNPLDLDLQLRLAAFDHVARLRERFGGLIPSRALNEGFEFRGERAPLWNQQKGIYKPAILGRGGAALSIQTSANGPYDDRQDEGSPHLLYRYRGTDPEHPDNVALRRALARRRPLLYFIGVDSGLYRAVFPCYITADRPRDLAVELLADASTRDIAAAAGEDPLLTAPLKAYTTQLVKRRLHQDRFHFLVMHAYRDQCAMCRLRHTPLLEAAHIIPDREESSQPVVSNGLSLCRIHHGAYDTRILGVDPDYRVHVRADVLEEVDGPMLRHGLQEMQGTRLSVPRRAADKPDRDLLAVQFGRFRAA